jgi:hypothetical protein
MDISEKKYRDVVNLLADYEISLVVYCLSVNPLTGKMTL